MTAGLRGRPPGITLGYIGVHQIYQLALAAHEIGRLDRFYCSLLDAPGKWLGMSYFSLTLT